MNTFDKKLQELGCYPFKAREISIMLVILTFKCNLRCAHCYLEASPDRTEDMSLETIDSVLDVLTKHEQITTLEFTGGEPVLNQHFRYFVNAAASLNRRLTMATNVTLFNEPGMEDIPELLAEKKVKVFASLPYYSQDIMERQRGKGTYDKVIASLKRLNALGYAQEGSPLELDIEFNPPGTDFVPDPETLEKIFREKLMELHGITFNHLVTLNNAPLGRTRKRMSNDAYDAYMKKLEGRFNEDSVKKGSMLCKYMICVSPEGDLYDCGFYRKLNIPLKDGPMNIRNFDYEKLCTREIVTSPMCFYCAADAGVSCYQPDLANKS